MSIIPIADPADPRIADYRNVPDPELLRRRGLFVAENRLVVRTLLASPRIGIRSVLVTNAAHEALKDLLEAGAHRNLPVYVCPKSLMEPISGFHIHRGCLALGERPAPMRARSLLAQLPGARRLVVLDAVTNADNMGGIFRNARAFGVDGVIVGPRCCDPLYRKAIRVSIGATLTVPFAHESTGPVEEIRQAGFAVVALTPARDAIDLAEFCAAPLPARIALVAGNEGEGLSAEALGAADVKIRIAMAAGVDSINVAAAMAIALQRLAPDPLR